MNGLFPLISKPLSALLGVLVGMLLIGLVVFGVDVERSLIVFVEEFSAEALAKESTNIILIHALEIHPIVSLSFIVFSMLVSQGFRDHVLTSFGVIFGASRNSTITLKSSSM